MSRRKTLKIAGAALCTALVLAAQGTNQLAWSAEAVAGEADAEAPALPRGVEDFRSEGGLFSFAAAGTGLHDLLALLSRGSGVEIEVAPGAEGTVTTTVSGQGIEDAVKEVLQAADQDNWGGEYRREEQTGELRLAKVTVLPSWKGGWKPKEVPVERVDTVNKLKQKIVRFRGKTVQIVRPDGSVVATHRGGGGYQTERYELHTVDDLAPIEEQLFNPTWVRDYLGRGLTSGAPISLVRSFQISIPWQHNPSDALALHVSECQWLEIGYKGKDIGCKPEVFIYDGEGNELFRGGREYENTLLEISRNGKYFAVAPNYSDDPVLRSVMYVYNMRGEKVLEVPRSQYSSMNITSNEKYVTLLNPSKSGRTRVSLYEIGNEGEPLWTRTYPTEFFFGFDYLDFVEETGCIRHYTSDDHGRPIYIELPY